MKQNDCLSFKNIISLDETHGWQSKLSILHGIKQREALFACQGSTPLVSKVTWKLSISPQSPPPYVHLLPSSPLSPLSSFCWLLIMTGLVLGCVPDKGERNTTCQGIKEKLNYFRMSLRGSKGSEIVIRRAKGAIAKKGAGGWMFLFWMLPHMQIHAHIHT